MVSGELHSSGRRRCLALAGLAGLVLAAGAGAVIAATTSVAPRWDLEFGSTAPDAALAGTATVDTAGNKTVGGAAFDLGGAVRRGQFALRGVASSAYSCSLPPSITLSSGASTVTVDSFTSSPLTGTFPNAGRLNFNVGGTLQIPFSQPAGAYTGLLDLTCDGITNTINVLATLGTFLSIANTVTLNFGTIGATTLAGTATVDPAGARTGANVDLLPSAPTAATFAVTGEPNQAYTITYPASAILTGPGADITLNTFTDNNPAPALSGAGTDSFSVGGTISIGASQAGGTYSGNFSVTINYN